MPGICPLFVCHLSSNCTQNRVWCFFNKYIYVSDLPINKELLKQTHTIRELKTSKHKELLIHRRTNIKIASLDEIYKFFYVCENNL